MIKVTVAWRPKTASNEKEALLKLSKKLSSTNVSNVTRLSFDAFTNSSDFNHLCGIAFIREIRNSKTNIQLFWKNQINASFEIIGPYFTQNRNAE